MPLVWGCQLHVLSKWDGRRAYGSEIHVNHGPLLLLILDELGTCAIGTGGFEHQVAAHIFREQRRPHLLLDGVTQKLEEGERGEVADID
jgi:hypothetical protein